LRHLAAAVLLALAACATTRQAGEDDSPSIVGSYVLTRIDNRALPTYSPTEPNVQVGGGTLTLGSAGAFVLTLVARNSPQLPPTEQSMRGSYTESDGTLTVTPTGGPDREIVYGVMRAGVRLTLRDPQGHRYEFTAR
jgi:hypothetical protein